MIHIHKVMKFIISCHSDTSGVLVARTLYMVCGTCAVTVVVMLFLS